MTDSNDANFQASFWVIALVPFKTLYSATISAHLTLMRCLSSTENNRERGRKLRRKVFNGRRVIGPIKIREKKLAYCVWGADTFCSWALQPAAGAAGC